MDVSGIPHQTQTLHTSFYEQNRMFLDNINLMVREYNDNINYYNGNIRRIIEIIQHHQTMMLRYDPYLHTPQPTVAPPAPPRARETTFATLPSLFGGGAAGGATTTSSSHGSSGAASRRYRTLFPGTWVNVRNGINALFEDVVIQPSDAQIATAVEEIAYTGVGGICPITLDPFESDERISRIRHCGHVFKRTALNDWFSRNVKCPICRYDIRNYIPGSEGRTREEQREETKEETKENEQIEVHMDVNVDVELEMEDQDESDMDYETQEEEEESKQNQHRERNRQENRNPTIQTSTRSMLLNAIRQLTTPDPPSTPVQNNSFQNLLGNVFRQYLQREFENNPDMDNITFDITY